MNHDDVGNVLPFVAAKHHVSYPGHCAREAGAVKKHDPSYRRGQSELSKGVSGTMSTPGTRVLPFLDGMTSTACTPPMQGIIDCLPHQIDPPLMWPPAITWAEPPLSTPKIEPSKGYHINAIPRGQFGEASKIVEEVKEFEDAVQQGCTVMALVELADLLGAIEGYLEKHHPTIKMTDLQKMADITKRVFKNGHRR